MAPKRFAGLTAVTVARRPCNLWNEQVAARYRYLQLRHHRSMQIGCRSRGDMPDHALEATSRHGTVAPVSTG